jgi:hypothetical protein
VRRKVGQDGLLLHNYNYRTSAGFPSPVSLENGLNPVPFGTDPMGPHEAKKAQQHNRHLTCLDSNFHRD